MLKPTIAFLIALVCSIGFIYCNVYPVARLHGDANWGSSGSGFVSTYGFPLDVCISAGCFTGSSFFYGNLIANLFAWSGAAIAVIAMPFLTALTRTLWKAGVKSVSDAFNYGGLIPNEHD